MDQLAHIVVEQRTAVLRCGFLIPQGLLDCCEAGAVPLMVIADNMVDDSKVQAFLASEIIRDCRDVDSGFQSYVARRCVPVANITVDFQTGLDQLLPGDIAPFGGITDLRCRFLVILHGFPELAYEPTNKTKSSD